jgi:hypothetical protein
LQSAVYAELVRTYLDGVILVRSSPMVFMTRRPQVQRPREMPTPPYSRIQMGVLALAITWPVVPVSHRDTRGPIALLRRRERLVQKLGKLET